jgi:hypothetical protein
VVPLPVELMSFDGEVTDEGIVLKWTTASELNNDYFILERSVDGYSFFEVEVVSGHGTTNELIDYAVLDSDPIFGPSYYRLSQVDYDGTLSIFNPIQINNESLMKGISATLFPNPTQSYNVNLNFVSGDEVSPIQVAIYDMRGARVHYEILEPKVGNTQYHLKPTNELGTGVYQVVVIQNNNQEIQRVIIK